MKISFRQYSDVESAREGYCRAIDRVAAEHLMGQKESGIFEEYRIAEEAARDWLSSSDDREVPRAVNSMAKAKNIDAREAALQMVRKAEAWREHVMTIREIRQSYKERVRKADCERVMETEWQSSVSEFQKADMSIKIR